MQGPEMLLRNTSLGPDISPLNVLVEYLDSNILHFKIGAPGRWEVPKDDIFINTGAGKFSLKNLRLKLTSDAMSAKHDVCTTLVIHKRQACS